jgi:hypothetical protein
MDVPSFTRTVLDVGGPRIEAFGMISESRSASLRTARNVKLLPEPFSKIGGSGHAIGCHISSVRSQYFIGVFSVLKAYVETYISVRRSTGFGAADQRTRGRLDETFEAGL